MKCFIAIEEDALEELWLKHPELVGPFTRPFLPSELTQNKLAPSKLATSQLLSGESVRQQARQCCIKIQLEAQAMRLKPSANDAEPPLKT